MIIYGGTGTLGSKIAEKMRHLEGEITIFSRDEQKQQAMRAKFPKFRYVIGDIRDPASVDNAMHGHDTVYHVAAMKHVDVVEENVSEAVQTNLLGSINIACSAISHDVKKVVFSSTDKAVLPINIYGHTKAIIERYYLSQNKKDGPQFDVFRWGNVLGSRGSAVHAFAKSLEEEGKIYITHRDMSRFWILIDDAVDFMLRSKGSSRGGVLYPKMKAASVIRVASALAALKGISDFEVVETGIRPGEKIHECLESNHEFCIRSDTAPQLTDEELAAMLRRVL